MQIHTGIWHSNLTEFPKSTPGAVSPALTQAAQFPPDLSAPSLAQCPRGALSSHCPSLHPTCLLSSGHREGASPKKRSAALKPSHDNWNPQIVVISFFFFSSQTYGTALSIIRFWVYKKHQHLLPTLCTLPVWRDCSRLAPAFVLAKRENFAEPGAGLLAKGSSGCIWDWQQKQRKGKVRSGVPQPLAEFNLMSLS